MSQGKLLTGAFKPRVLEWVYNGDPASRIFLYNVSCQQMPLTEASLVQRPLLVVWTPVHSACLEERVGFFSGHHVVFN